MSHVCFMRVAKHNGCDKQCVSGMSAPFSMMAGEKCSKKKRGEKCGEKHSEKRGGKFYRRRTAVWDLSRLFSFRSRELLATRVLDPFPWRSGSVAGSLSVQCSPLSNLMRLNVLKDFIHPILGATLIKTGTNHDMW